MVKHFKDLYLFLARLAVVANIFVRYGVSARVHNNLD